MLLRPATLEAGPSLATLGRESICAAFAHLYRREDLDAFLTQAYSPDAVTEEIADEHHIHRLAVGDDGGRLLGFVKMRVPSPYVEHSGAANPIALGQLYTQPDLTGQGSGAALMDWAIVEAVARGHDAIQLSVWSENAGAQRFYQRYGFAKIADIDFWVGTHRDDEFLFEKRL